MASRTESLIWSAILSGCPSVTDSEVKRRPASVQPTPVRSAIASTLAIVPAGGTAVRHQDPGNGAEDVVRRCPTRLAGVGAQPGSRAATWSQITCASAVL